LFWDEQPIAVDRPPEFPLIREIPEVQVEGLIVIYDWPLVVEIPVDAGVT
jgi:hypothetical protein